MTNKLQQYFPMIRTEEEVLSEINSRSHLEQMYEEWEKEEQKEFLEEIISPHLHTMFVTPKDVDETVRYLGFTISEGLNMAFAQQE